MSHHNEAVGWLNDFASEGVLEEGGALRGSNSEVKMAENKKNEMVTRLCQCIVHLGDLSPQTYPWRIAREWERRIAREFKQQTLKEEKLEIPTRDFMTKTDLSSRYKSQFFFVSHVVKPLYEPAARLFPEIHDRLATLKANANKYIDIANKKTAAAVTKE